jgi:glutamate carboxypeptidase
MCWSRRRGWPIRPRAKAPAIWRIDVKGVAAHAGVDFEKGASAIRELARVVETVSGWTDLKRGLTVSVGVAGGGTKSNVIPAGGLGGGGCADCPQGGRPAHRAEVRRAEAGGQALRTDGDGGINRPPMERTRGTVKLYRKARALAAELGFTLEEAATGGASDGNFTAALGIPTLDGMGAVGEGAHASHESIVVEHLAPRTALLAGLLASSQEKADLIFDVELVDVRSYRSAEQLLERLYVFSERRAAGVGHAIEGLRLALDELLFDGDVAGFFKLEQLRAQVAVRCAGL